MKLYTEEQVKDMLNTFIGERNVNDYLQRYYTHIELPSDEEMWRWWQTQKFQKEQGLEQEYTMLYEIDLLKILKAFIEHFSKTYGGNK
jgi:hypothetical protein